METENKDNKDIATQMTEEERIVEAGLLHQQKTEQNTEDSSLQQSDKDEEALTKSVKLEYETLAKPEIGHVEEQSEVVHSVPEDIAKDEKSDSNRETPSEEGSVSAELPADITAEQEENEDGSVVLPTQEQKEEQKEDDVEEKLIKRGRKKKEELLSEDTTASKDVPPVEQTDAPLVIAEQLSLMQIEELNLLTQQVLEHDDFHKIKEAFLLLRNRYEQLEDEFEQNSLISISEKSKTDQVSEEDIVPIDTSETSNEIDELKNQFSIFKGHLKKYSFLRKQHGERIEAEKIRNYELKKQILEELKQLIESEETLQKTWEDFKRLQQQWKEIGQVPPNQSQDLWNSFNHLVDMFLDKVKINRELRDLDYKKNLEAKIEICEKIEDLFIEESIDNAFKRLRDLQTLWRETGPVPSDKREEINERFANSIEKLIQKRRDIYESFRQQLEQNLELKKALVVKIKDVNEQDLTTPKAWIKKTEEVEELMKMWKTIGPVHKKYNEQIWQEFRQEMSRFFEEKKQYFKKMKDEQMENYNKKLLLCKQAETLQESNEWKKTTAELISLQNEWKTIGHVPHRYSDTIWKRFRQACDGFFNRKQEYFSNLDKNEEVNLKAKQELIEQMVAYEFGDDNKENLKFIKDFQRKFFDIGRVPIKQKDEIQKKFQSAVDSLLEKLNIDKVEKRKFDLKEKYQNMSDTPAGQAGMKKEVFGISSKINKLESDIQLWENNIEFFAKSKNADLLTKEFREKIEKGKADLLILKEKQKMLKNMMK
jgi:hypothetical protein